MNRKVPAVKPNFEHDGYFPGSKSDKVDTEFSHFTVSEYFI